jgi:hypothetical protein
VGPVLGSPEVLETRIRKGPVQTVREYRPTLIKGVVSTERSRPTEETSPESIHGVVLYVRQDVGVDAQGHVDTGVTEDLLQHFLRVLPALQPEGREGVAQGVEGDLFR